ncbi:hypothetical protein [Amycolatopsis sp. cmx-4-68]|uniref:hypothetical protein n=1 Tax=Amycolatopsis sp. cmx-4-68 TaxID=2790938 RepID=UPI00397C14DB
MSIAASDRLHPASTGRLSLRARRPHADSASVPVQGSKNCFNHLALLALAGDDLTFTLRGTPAISDRTVVRQMLHSCGVATDLSGDVLRTQGRPRSVVLDESGARLRVTICYAAALAANLGRADCPFPGGDMFTVRPIDLHLRVLEAAGARCRLSDDGGVLSIEFASTPRAVDVSLLSAYGPSMGASVTGLVVAAQAVGTSTLRGLCPEPEVRGVVDALRALGVGIDDVDDDVVRVHGVGGPLSGALDVTVPPDRIEALTYLLVGAVRHRETTVDGIARADLPEGVHTALRAAGLSLRDSGLPHGRPATTLVRDATPRGIDISTAPHPGYPTDAQPQLAAFLTQAETDSAITESVYAARTTHVPELARLGLSVAVHDSRQVITGRQLAHGGHATVRDIRCGAALIVAAAATDQGVHLYDPAGHLARGYGDLAAKLHRLGIDLDHPYPSDC